MTFLSRSSTTTAGRSKPRSSSQCPWELPLSSSAVGQETRFITFTEDEVKTGDDGDIRPIELRGLNMEFDLDIIYTAIWQYPPIFHNPAKHR